MVSQIYSTDLLLIKTNYFDTVATFLNIFVLQQHQNLGRIFCTSEMHLSPPPPPPRWLLLLSVLRRWFCYCWFVVYCSLIAGWWVRPQTERRPLSKAFICWLVPEAWFLPCTPWLNLGFSLALTICMSWARFFFHNFVLMYLDCFSTMMHCISYEDSMSAKQVCVLTKSSRAKISRQ